MAQPRGFHYETLLRIRSRQEDLQVQALLGARRKVADAQRQRAELAREQQEAMRVARTLTRDRFDARDVRRYYQYERYLARLGDDKESEIAQLEAAAEEERLALIEATKRKKVMERLKEKRLAEAARELRKIEQKIEDETALVHRVSAHATSPRDYAEEGSR